MKRIVATQLRLKAQPQCHRALTTPARERMRLNGPRPDPSHGLLGATMSDQNSNSTSEA